MSAILTPEDKDALGAMSVEQQSLVVKFWSLARGQNNSQQTQQLMREISTIILNQNAGGDLHTAALRVVQQLEMHDLGPNSFSATVPVSGQAEAPVIFEAGATTFKPELYQSYKHNDLTGIYMGTLGDVDPELDPNKKYAWFVLPENLTVYGKTKWSLDEVNEYQKRSNGFIAKNLNQYGAELKSAFERDRIEGKKIVPTDPMVRALVANKDNGTIAGTVIAESSDLDRCWMLTCTSYDSDSSRDVLVFWVPNGYGAGTSRKYTQASCRQAFVLKV